MRTWHSLILLAALCPGGPAPAGGGECVSRVTPVVLAYQKARPAVVNISAEKIVSARLGLFGRDVFDEIFPSPFTRRVPVKSLGSGFVVHPDGFVVTNAHVVQRAQQITVAFDDKTRLPAQVISAEPAHDLAVLKIDPPKGKSLAFLPLARSDDLMVGETVIAIGNPMGYGHTLTTGVISAVDRKLEFNDDVVYDKLIQTDAPINPGSSGGPLLNIRGELIGINTAIRADAQNIGFAIAVDSLADELPVLLDFERMNRAIFGAAVRQRHGAAGPELYVAELRPGTPAAGSLRVGDLLKALDGKPLGQIPDFVCAMLAVKPPASVALQCIREGKEQAVRVEVKAKPRPDGRLLAWQLFGVDLREITPQLARDRRLPTDKGLLVTAVDPRGPAERIGLRADDVVFQVGQAYVHELETLGMVLENVPPGQAVKIGVARGSVAAWVQVQARARPAGAAPPKEQPKVPAAEGDTPV